MRYEEVTVAEAFDLSPHHHKYINPYNGCSMGCPFCYWLSRVEWEGRIQVRTNIVQCIQEELQSWQGNEWLYLGSVCDPFNELEEKYGLSEACIELVQSKNIPILITSSAVNEYILQIGKRISLRDKRNEKRSRLVFVIELARLSEIEKLNAGKKHLGIVHANALKEMGFEVWATLAPLCPGLIEIEPVLEQLHSHIPLYIDALQCRKNEVQAERMFAWVKKVCPERLKEYEEIILKGNQDYYERILNQYRNNDRIKQFPFEL